MVQEILGNFLRVNYFTKKVSILFSEVFHQSSKLDCFYDISENADCFFE